MFDVTGVIRSLGEPDAAPEGLVADLEAEVDGTEAGAGARTAAVSTPFSRMARRRGAVKWSPAVGAATAPFSEA